MKRLLFKNIWMGKIATKYIKEKMLILTYNHRNENQNMNDHFHYLKNWHTEELIYSCKDPFTHCWQECKSLYSFGGPLEVSNKINMDIPFDPDISTVFTPRMILHSFFCQATYHTYFMVQLLVDYCIFLLQQCIIVVLLATFTLRELYILTGY